MRQKIIHGALKRKWLGFLLFVMMVIPSLIYFNIISASNLKTGIIENNIQTEALNHDEPRGSASSPFIPSPTFTGTGTSLPVTDTFNGTIPNDDLVFQTGINTTVPIIAPVLAANISAVSVNLNPIPAAQVEIPWNESVSLENKTINTEVVAQSFNVPDYSIIQNVSIFGLGTGHNLGNYYEVTVTLVQGVPSSTRVVSTRSWDIFPYYAFTDSATPRWYNFDIPDNTTAPGLYSVIFNVTQRVIMLGSVDFFIVNDTGIISEIGYNYTGITWETITGDFSIKLGIASPSAELLGKSLIQAKISTSAWINFSKTTFDATLKATEGSPWTPGLQIYNFLPYYGLPLLMRSNNSMSVNATINITYHKHARSVTTLYAFDLSATKITWNGTYNSSLPAWNENIINGTVYDFHVESETQRLTIEMPARWNAINVTQPDMRLLGDVSSIVVTNASSYVEKTWKFVANSPAMPFTMALNATLVSNKDEIEVSGSMVENFTASFTGNASFWLNETMMDQSFIQTFSGQNFTFSENIIVPNSTIAPSGYYSCLVLVKNGTDIGYSTTTIQLFYAARAFIIGNETLRDIEGPHDATITTDLFLSINKTNEGVAGATVNTTWGIQGSGWMVVEGTSAGVYHVTLNTNSSYCVPGDNKIVTISFTRPDMSLVTLDLAVHPWKPSILVTQAINTTVHVNQTVFFGFNYTDSASSNLSAILSFNYNLGSHTQANLGFPVMQDTEWTRVIQMNMTLIPAIQKSGNYTFTLNASARLANGTWYQPRQYTTTFNIIPLPISWSVIRCDMTFNETITTSLEGEEFEGVGQDRTIWIHVNKTLYILENNTEQANASDLIVRARIGAALYDLEEITALPGVYACVVDLSNHFAPETIFINITISGNDVESRQFFIRVDIIKRYALRAELLGGITEFIEEQYISFNLRLYYTDKDGITRPYALESVQVNLVVFDGSFNTPYTFNLVTNQEGVITISNVRLPRLTGNGYIAYSITAGEDEKIDPTIACNARLPIVQNFWNRWGFSVGLLIIAGIFFIIIFLKAGIPKLKSRRADNKILAIKSKHDGSKPSQIPIDSSSGRDALDIESLKATEGFAMMHIGPPDVIDLDLSTRYKKSKRGISADLELERQQAQNAAATSEASGDLDSAIMYYEKQIRLANELGLNDEAWSCEKKVEKLKAKKQESTKVDREISLE